MSDTPFGFGVPPEEPEDGEGGRSGDGENGKSRPGGSGASGSGSSGSGSSGSGSSGSGSESGSGSSGSGSAGPGGGNPFGFTGGSAFPFGIPGLGGPGVGGPGAGGDNPLAAMFGGLNPGDLGAAFQQLGQMLSFEGGPVNWEMAKNIARETVAQGTQDGTKDASVGSGERAAVQEALRLADLWLDDTTSLPSGAGSAVAWSRAEWVEATLPVWQELVDPVAERVGTAMGGVLPEEMQAVAGPLIGMMRSMGGAMFGTQIGQALGVLAGEVVGSTDIGLPLGPAGKAALIPVNITAFGSGLGVPQEEVRLYLALREAAHQRLFAHVPWLRAHLFGAVEGYARGIEVDTARLEDAVGQLDPTNPQALQDALQQGMFQPEDTPQQKAALARLETALALVEGWVDAVVHAAAAPHLPSAGALRETLRRRRASGGPAEQTFATLIGLELRPRRLRDASRLWASLTDARGVDGRDALWAHPDMLPTAADLDDPDGFVHREQDEAFDFDALEELLGDAARSENTGPDAAEDGGAEDGDDKRDRDSDGDEGKGDGRA